MSPAHPHGIAVALPAEPTQQPHCPPVDNGAGSDDLAWLGYEAAFPFNWLRADDAAPAA